MRIVKPLIIFLLIFLILFPMSYVPGFGGLTVNSGPDDAGISSLEIGVFSGAKRHYDFYYGGRYWVFYPLPDGDYSLNYTTSSDFDTWTTYGIHDGVGWLNIHTTAGQGSDFLTASSYAVDFDGTRVHLAWYREDIAICYLSGVPSVSTGEISWYTPFHYVYNSTYEFTCQLDLCVATDGHPWIGFTAREQGSGNYIYNITRSDSQYPADYTDTWDWSLWNPHNLASGNYTKYLYSLHPSIDGGVFSFATPQGLVSGSNHHRVRATYWSNTVAQTENREVSSYNVTNYASDNGYDYPWWTVASEQECEFATSRDNVAHFIYKNGTTVGSNYGYFHWRAWNYSEYPSYGSEVTLSIPVGNASHWYGFPSLTVIRPSSQGLWLSLACSVHSTLTNHSVVCWEYFEGSWTEHYIAPLNFQPATTRLPQIHAAITVDDVVFGQNATFPIYWTNHSPGVNDAVLVETSEAPIVMGANTITVTNMEGCGNWVFAEKQYYDFQANYSHGDAVDNASEYFDTVMIAFTDGLNWINASYDCVDTEFAMVAGGGEYDDEIARITQQGSVTESGLDLIVVFEIYLTSNVLDVLNVDLYAWANTTTGGEYPWTVIQTDHFHIYNKGGILWSQVSTNSSQYRPSGGGPFDAVCGEGSYQVEYVYRHLAHVRLQPEITYLIPTSDEGFHINYYLDYCRSNDTDFITGIRVELSYIQTVEGDPGTQRYMEWQVSIYQGNYRMEFDSVYSYPRNGTGTAGDVETTRLWIDLWFDRTNSSSVCGARVVAYEFPIERTGLPEYLLWLSNSWGPAPGLDTDLTMFATTRDASNNTIYGSQMKLMLLGMWLVSDYGQNITVRDYNVFDLTLMPTERPFEGISTPQAMEPILPANPGGGVIGVVWGFFSWLGDVLGKYLGPALLGFWDAFVGFMDTLFTWAGWEDGFSQIVSWIVSFLAWLANATNTLIQLLTTFFYFVADLISPLVDLLSLIGTLITNIFLSITGMISWVNSAYNDTVLPLTPIAVNVVVLIGIMLPFWELARAEKYGFGVIFEDLRLVADVTSFLLTTVWSVITFIFDLITGLINLIPVIE